MVKLNVGVQTDGNNLILKERRDRRRSKFISFGTNFSFERLRPSSKTRKLILIFYTWWNGKWKLLHSLLTCFFFCSTFHQIMILLQELLCLVMTWIEFEFKFIYRIGSRKIENSFKSLSLVHWTENRRRALHLIYFRNFFRLILNGVFVWLVTLKSILTLLQLFLEMRSQKLSKMMPKRKNHKKCVKLINSLPKKVKKRSMQKVSHI